MTNLFFQILSELWQYRKWATCYKNNGDNLFIERFLIVEWFLWYCWFCHLDPEVASTGFFSEPFQGQCQFWKALGGGTVRGGRWRPYCWTISEDALTIRESICVSRYAFCWKLRPWHCSHWETRAWHKSWRSAVVYTTYSLACGTDQWEVYRKQELIKQQIS